MAFAEYGSENLSAASCSTIQSVTEIKSTHKVGKNVIVWAVNPGALQCQIESGLAV